MNTTEELSRIEKEVTKALELIASYQRASHAMYLLAEQTEKDSDSQTYAYQARQYQLYSNNQLDRIGNYMETACKLWSRSETTNTEEDTREYNSIKNIRDMLRQAETQDQITYRNAGAAEGAYNTRITQWLWTGTN